MSRYPKKRAKIFERPWRAQLQRLKNTMEENWEEYPQIFWKNAADLKMNGRWWKMFHDWPPSLKNGSRSMQEIKRDVEITAHKTQFCSYVITILWY